MRISDFDYELPEELIAQHPLAERDASRMLVVNRSEANFRDDKFVSLLKYLRPGDCLVLNNTKVFPARLIGERAPTGGAIELLLLREIEPGTWQVLARPARRLRVGGRIHFAEGKLDATIIGVNDDGTRVIQFEQADALVNIIDEIGRAPLPPYIKRDHAPSREDRERYQTVYARERGAIAAPTAGLHFTPTILNAARAAGVSVTEITLHVGFGTFEPVRVDDISQHCVLPETFAIGAESAEAINRTRATGGRIVAVGTTTTRALESAASANGEIGPMSGSADLTITPGYKFRVIDALLTNFHLPRSSLILLVSAFGGRDLILAAYGHAVRERYRFYSYGDCMLIL